MAEIRSSAGILVSYDDRKPEVIRLIRRNLAALMKSLSTGNILLGFQVSPPLHVLGSHVKIRGIPEGELTRHVLFTAAIQLQSLPAPEIPDLVEAIGRAAQNYRKRPVLEYHILLPLNVEQRLTDGTGSFTIGKMKLLCDSWMNVQRVYEVDRLIAEVNHYIGNTGSPDLWHWSGTPLIAKVRARDTTEAFRRAEQAFELLRAVFNFLDDRLTVQLQKPEPLGSLRPPVGYGVFLPDGTYAEYFVSPEYLSFQKCVQPPEDKARVYELLSQLALSSRPEDTACTFAKAFRAYGLALESVNWRDCYLALWQTLEIMTFDREKHYDMGAVAERAYLLMGRDETIRDFLNVCAAMRNNFVHRGQFSDDGQPEVLSLKSVVRFCLVRFLAMTKTYPTWATLSEFFEHAGTSSEKLAVRKQVIGSILANRN